MRYLFDPVLSEVLFMQSFLPPASEGKKNESLTGIYSTYAISCLILKKDSGTCTLSLHAAVNKVAIVFFE
jgi:hypothetical protein